MNAQKDMEKAAAPAEKAGYAARLDIDYPEQLNRLTTFFRLFTIIPIGIILGLLTNSGQKVTNTVVLNQAGHIVETTRDTAGGLLVGIPVAVALMILFVQRYPRWWFDFQRELVRFSNRVGAYALLLTDQYPSTVDEQAVHLEIDYPDVEKDLKRGMPLVKWFLAIPHYLFLAVLVVGAVFAVIIAWFAILFTGRYPESLFNYVVGVMRWGLRVNAYATLLVTDEYPPFSLD
ncbi:DUF4389 domain-containing protein [Pelolinea submarina]|uniref:Uncharacterized protein DUF4389 n=1 Tax=Pelolinea submarina TaxID=913107 RepID=A0A347ZQK0_9CHLR|nr:DUF4389 domain-containing protein [Pelolinea submarina]REG06085.1 uncharacterized protein DUF4389 [Pelolinea submarina]BBB47581.1 hypothetical protein Pelsub_P0808 [Pelolinea submarina]